MLVLLLSGLLHPLAAAQGVTCALPHGPAQAAPQPAAPATGAGDATVPAAPETPPPQPAPAGD